MLCFCLIGTQKSAAGFIHSRGKLYLFFSVSLCCLLIFKIQGALLYTQGEVAQSSR